jgi:hypothetical protein
LDAASRRNAPIGAVDQLDAAKLYERRWVTTLLTSAGAVEQEFRDSGKGELFEGLKGSLLAEEP